MKNSKFQFRQLRAECCGGREEEGEKYGDDEQRRHKGDEFDQVRSEVDEVRGVERVRYDEGTEKRQIMEDYIWY